MKLIKNFSDYKVNKFGQVWSYKRKISKILKPTPDKDGYLQVVLRKNGKSFTKKIHRIVAEAYIPNKSNKPQVNHKNGIKSDNTIENLEWCTDSENKKHASMIGLTQKGEKNSHAKLNEQDIYFIRHSNLKNREIAEKHNIHIRHVFRIKSKERWNHI